MPDLVSGFTVEVDGHPDDIRRLWAAFSNELSKIEKENHRRYPSVDGSRYLYYNLSSVKGTVTFRKDLKSAEPKPPPLNFCSSCGRDLHGYVHTYPCRYCNGETE